ncbi:MAG TPA: DUF2167 domain-containing protein [Polyangiaceae bacterium]|nr:DUF2167 domain-containing protein [Polyangiaceae bacterium]
MTRSVRSLFGVWAGFLVALCCIAVSLVARAEPSEPAGATSAEAAGPPPEWQPGPRTVNLGHDIKVELPADYMYLPPAEAKKALEKGGSFHNDAVLGLLASVKPSDDWFVVLQYEDSGYVKDDEKLDADELLSSMREAVKDSNEERVKRGFKPLALDGWSEPPRYEKAQHHMVWALIVSDPDGKSVNFNTRVLGRRGYVSLNLVTAPESLATYKSNATTLLAATHFDSGARYEDFNEKTDKVAEYGLTGLILAGAGLGAAKLVKIGLLAKFWKVLIGIIIAGKKAIVLAVLAIGGAIKKFFGSKGNQETPSASG